MRFRKLRIAFSATCLVACVLLIALWVRSRHHRHNFLSRVTANRVFATFSDQGMIAVEFGTNSYPQPRHGFFRSFATRADQITSRWSLQLNDKHSYLTVPHWAVIAFVAAVGAAPWLRWRFSLRTLLIATTLVAVVLGLIVAVLR
jgi:hypothetical protein